MLCGFGATTTGDGLDERLWAEKPAALSEPRVTEFARGTSGDFAGKCGGKHVGSAPVLRENALRIEQPLVGERGEIQPEARDGIGRFAKLGGKVLHMTIVPDSNVCSKEVEPNLWRSRRIGGEAGLLGRGRAGASTRHQAPGTEPEHLQPT